MNAKSYSYSQIGVCVAVLIFLFLGGCVGVDTSPKAITSPPEVIKSPISTASPTELAPEMTSTPRIMQTLENLITETATAEPTQSLTPTGTPSLTVEATIAEPLATMIRSIDSMLMVYVPAGSFLMGSSEGELEIAYAQCNQEVVNSDCPPGRFDDETPQHNVTLDAFWIDRTEVSVAQYQQCMDVGACEPWGCYNPESEIGAPELPIGCVTWYQAQKYCQWVGARLPTEAEWEYAARGPESNVYPWGDHFDVTRLNYCDLNCYNRWRDPDYDDGYNSLAPVGTFISGTSWCGALDMAGNAAELVIDWYDPDYYASSPARNPAGPDTGTLVVFKGGASNHGASYVRSAWRATIPPDSYYGIVGFRCVISE